MPKSKKQEMFTDDMAKSIFIFDTGDRKPYTAWGKPRVQKPYMKICSFARVGKSNRSRS